MASVVPFSPDSLFDEPEPETGMTEGELASLLASHESRAVGYYNSEVAGEQEQALNYYYGKMDDLPALDGCSSVVDHTVSVHVDGALAAILKPFVSSDETVSFEPRGPEDTGQAEQATEFVNYIINCDNPGFQIFHDWFKDALITKLGVIKVWWEDTSKDEAKTVPADAMMLEQLRADPNYLGEQEVQPGVYAVSINETVTDGRVRIENVPPEEFLISPFARSIDDATYVAHRPSNYTRSDLIELGMDAEVVEALPAHSNTDLDDPRSQARYQDEDWGANSDSGADKSRDIIAVLDEYVRVDFDGDGISELRRVIRVNDIILFNEVTPDVPFATLCPVPMPHKVYGRSLADLAIEGQRVSTAITRSTLDNLYKTNNPRPIIGERAYTDTTAEDLGSTAPGAEIRVQDTGQIDWLVIPFAADKSFSMLEYIQQGVEERTGIQRKGNGFNAEALKKNSSDTATAASIDENSRNERAEMIGRIFAETGVKRLFKLVLKMVNQYQPKSRVIRLRNQWVEVDPRGLDPEMDVSITVGLGMGNKADQMEQASVVMQSMAELQLTPYATLIGPDKVYNGLKRLFNAAGIKNVDDFLNDPAQMPPEEPKPDPEMAKAQAEMQMKQVEMQGKQQEAMLKLQLQQQAAQASNQLEMAKAQAANQLEQQKAMAKAQLEQAKAQFQAQLALKESQQELELERAKLEMQRELGREKASIDYEISLSKQRQGGDLDK